MKLLGGLLYLTISVLTPVLGVWLASSLVSYSGGPTELALVAGALLFPVLPVWWELRATRAFNEGVKRKRQFGAAPKRSFTALGRIVLRTLFLNVVFLAVLVVWFPKQAFPALAMRGDWFLEGNAEPWAEAMRRDLHAAATGLEWLYELSNQNPYVKEGDLQPVPSSVQPVEESTGLEMPTARRWISGTSAWDGRERSRLRDTEPQPDPTPEWLEGSTFAVGDTRWPWKRAPLKSLARITAADEADLQTVGEFFKREEPEPFARVKGLHDWVVTRLRYDEDAIKPGAVRPPQDAVHVFGARKAVCEGYARLMVALGKVTGDDIVYLVGDVRDDDGSANPSPHAWNAVQVRGKWYLVDATWDDPTGVDEYRTDYLFIPPSVAVFDHLPWEKRWQMLSTPLSRGDFLRQPLVGPGMSRVGLTLVTPERSTVEVDGPLDVELENPSGAKLWLTYGDANTDCGFNSETKAHWRCDLPSGLSRVRLWHSTNGQGYEYLAELRVTRR
ncbi:MAG: hypothetical protein JNK82_30930 [Myxococcaceae bacterium]|nr:hypothetical protein [Myxococcaceae bacterium]